MGALYHHLTITDRFQIEAWTRAKVEVSEMAELLGVHISTIYRELKRGEYEHLNTDYTTEMRYSADLAEMKYRANLKEKGAGLKIGNDIAFANYIEQKIIKERYSPDAVLGEIKVKGMEFKTKISRSTLYSYIDKGIFLELSNRHLPVKKDKKDRKRQERPKRAPKGVSIEKRPAEVAERSTFGHLEMDCVEGAKGTKKTLLVLTERMTRCEIIRLMPDKTMKSVTAALNDIEKMYGVEMFGKVFKTITVDNGSEFSDSAGIEKSVNGGRRTMVFYCHPYSSYERGSNENTNKLVRRHYPKGCSFEKVSVYDIAALERWINNYPRGIFGFHCAAEQFEACIKAI